MTLPEIESLFSPAVIEAQRVVAKDRSTRRLVYRITSPSGRAYIGVTHSLSRRIREHALSDFQIGRSIKAHGLACHEIEVVAIAGAEDAYALESRAISVFDTFAPAGLNLAAGGKGVKNMALTSRAKLSASKRGIVPSNGTPEKFAEWTRTARRTEAHCDSISKALTGVPKSPAHRAALAEATRRVAALRKACYKQGIVAVPT